MRHSVSENKLAVGKAVATCSNPRGFTLIELIVTIAIAAIIVTIAVPGFQGLIQSNRVATQTNNFLSSIKLARSEAVKQGRSVTIAAVGNDFANGWCIYQGAAGTACSSATTIREFGEPSGIIFDDDGDTAFEFDGQGRLVSPDIDPSDPPGASPVTVKVDPKDCNGAKKGRRVVTINVIGRLSLATKDCS